MIYIYGHKSSMDRTEFSTKDAALDYLARGLPQQDFRYRTTYTAHATSVLFSFNGELLAELIVNHEEAPSEQDKQGYAKTRKVYVIDEIRMFQDPSVRAQDVGLKPSQFGTRVSEELYTQIIERAGGFSQTIRRS